MYEIPAGLTDGPIFLLDGVPCVLPTKTPPMPVVPATSHKVEIDGRTYYEVEINQTIIRPQSSKFTLSSHLPALASSINASHSSYFLHLRSGLSVSVSPRTGLCPKRLLSFDLFIISISRI